MMRIPARLLCLCLLALLTGAGWVRAQTGGHPAPELLSEVSRLTTEGHYTRALQAAIELAQKVKAAVGERHTQYADAVSWVGTIYQSMGRLEEAGPNLEQALELYQSLRPPGHPDIATATNNLGFYHQSSGRYEEAEKLYTRALEMRQRAVEPDELAVAESLNNVAQILKRQARHGEAEPLLARSLEIRERRLGSTHVLVAQSYQNLAALLELDNRFPDAEAMLRKVLDIRRQTQREGHPDISAATGKLAQNLYKQRRYEDADQLFRSALAMQRRPRPGGSTGGGFSAVNAAGQPQTGDTFVEGTTISTQFDFALNLLELGRLDEAEQLLGQVMSSHRQVLSATHPELANAHMANAELASRQSRHGEALTAIRPATEIRVARSGDDEMSRLTYLKHVRFAWRAYSARIGDPERLLNEALRIGQRAAHNDTAAAVARMAAQMTLRDKGLGNLVRERDDLGNLQQKLEQQLSRLMDLPKEQRGDAESEIRRSLTLISSRLAEIVDRDMRTRFPEYFNLLRPEPLGTAEVGQLLAPDEALVQMLCSYDETFVWVVTKETARWHRLEGTPDDIARTVARLRRSLDVEELKSDLIGWATRLGAESSPLFDLGLSHTLYRQLLGPQAEVIDRKKHLLVVPCGPLTSLPLQVLVTEPPRVAQPTMQSLSAYREAKWLVQRHAVTVLPSVPSLKSLRQLPRRADTRKAMLGFANPVFDRRPPGARGGPEGATRSLPTRTGYATVWRGRSPDLDVLRRELEPLPETEAEVQAVARTLGGGDLRVGAAASETEIKRVALADYQIIYFATHGLVAGEVKGLGEPALALSLPQAPSEQDDGLLTASEVAQLKLNADWVVLAACNTAAGDMPGAEALSGLARAFFHAGARALLVSHWRVGSVAAAKLTTSTFDIRKRDPKLGRAEALRRAMVAYAADQKDSWNAYPGFWGPFAVVGEGAN